jgi:simple sugar transport system ATP-binding protein
MTTGPALRIERATKRFGDLVAVDGASLALEAGVLHAIVGENGAGKSTLLKMAAGVLAPSAGRVLVGERPLEPATTVEASRRGVGLVHQHFMLVGAFSALDNVVLGSEPVLSGGRLDRAGAEVRVRVLMESAGLPVPLDALTDELTVGERQRLEILRVLYRGARALLLDEPTAVLSPLEAEELYATLRRLAAEGRAVAVVTHRLDEVVRFADRVTVMRRGRIVHDASIRGAGSGDRPTAGLEDVLTRAIMGGEPPPPFAPPPLEEDAPVVLAMAGLRLVDAAGRRLLDGVDLEVRAGEIVGVAGVEGNGQRELVRALAGLEPALEGSIAVAGEPLAARGPDAVRRRRASLAVVHEDRHADGLLLKATVADNLVLGDLGDPRAGRFDEAAAVARRMARFHVEPPDPARLAGELSGGNQQKLVVARALDRLLVSGARGAAVLAQPTRGVDVGAAASIHAAIGEAAAAGLGVLVVSADLAELRRLAHRVVVMRRGRLVATLPPSASEAEIGRAMLGIEAA